MPGDDSKKKPSDPEPLVRDAGEDAGSDLFGEPGSNLLDEDSTPSLLLTDAVGVDDDDENSTPSLDDSDAPLDPDSIALFGK